MIGRVHAKDFIVIVEIFVSVTVCKRKRKKNRKTKWEESERDSGLAKRTFHYSGFRDLDEFSSRGILVIREEDIILRESIHRRRYYQTKPVPQRMTIRETLKRDCNYPPFSWPHAHRSKFLHFHASSYDRFTRNYTIRLLVQAACKTFLGDWKRFQEDSVLDGCFRRPQRSTDFEGIWTVRKQPEPVLPVTRAILIRSWRFFYPWNTDCEVR